MNKSTEPGPEHPERLGDLFEQTRPRRARRERPGGPLVVVGIDSSDASQHALAFAAGAARRMRATLLVAYISTFGNTVYPTSLAPIPPDFVADQIAAARQLANEVLQDVVVPWSFTVGAGDAAAELARLADENSADVLVVGRSSTWLHRLAGSTASRLLRRARCPITVVP